MKLAPRSTAFSLLLLAVACALTAAEIASVEYFAQYRTVARGVPIVQLERVVVTAQREIPANVAIENTAGPDARPNRAGA